MNESIEYRGHTIEIINDNDAENPFLEWDCNPPLLASYDRSTKAYGDIDLTPPELSREQIKNNAKELCNLIPEKSLLEFTTTYCPYSRIAYDHAHDLINDAICNYVNQQTTSEKMKIISELFNMIGIVSLCTSVSGYSQGQY